MTLIVSGVASFLIQGEQQCSKLKISNQCTRFRENFRQYPCNRLRNYDNLIFQGEHVLQVLPCGDATAHCGRPSTVCVQNNLLYPARRGEQVSKKQLMACGGVTGQSCAAARTGCRPGQRQTA